MKRQIRKRGAQKSGEKRSISFFLGIFSLIILIPLSVLGATLEEELQQKQEQLNKYSDLRALKQKEQSLLSTQVAALESENSRVERTIGENRNELESIEHELVIPRQAITEKEKLLAAQKYLLSQLLRSHYERSKNKDVGGFLLTDKGAGFLAQDDHVSQTSAKIKEILESVNALRNDLLKNRSTLEEKQVRLVDLTHQMEQRSSYLESSRTYKQTLIASSKGEEQHYEKKISKIEQEIMDIQREIEEIEIGKIDSFSSSDLPSASSAGFIYPVAKPYKITQGYGKTSFSKNYASGMHNGIDFGYGGSSKIMAAASGKVVGTGNMGHYGYGKWIAIDHGNGIVTLYGHLSAIKVSSGAKVKRGDTIGTMGSTGYSTGQHLHFTVFAKKTFDVVESKKVSGVKIPTGASVNPMKYL